MYSILEQTREQINDTSPSAPVFNKRISLQYPSPSVYGCTIGTAPIYVSLEDDEKNTITSASDYVTILSPETEPCQSTGSLYADLSDQRGDLNQYQSLVKRKK